MLKNGLETAEMLKMLIMFNVFKPLGLENKTKFKNVFNISAVSSTFSKRKPYVKKWAKLQKCK